MEELRKNETPAAEYNDSTSVTKNDGSLVNYDCNSEFSPGNPSPYYRSETLDDGIAMNHSHPFGLTDDSVLQSSLHSSGENVCESSQRFSRDLSYGAGPDSSYNLLQTLAADSGYGSAHSIRSACSQNRYSGFPLPSNADMRHFSIDLYNNYESPSNRSSLSFNSAMLGRLSSHFPDDLSLASPYAQALCEDRDALDADVFSHALDQHSSSSESGDQVAPLTRQDSVKHIRRLDNSRRFGRRFDHPIGYALQEPEPELSLAMRQVSAPSLMTRDGEEAPAEAFAGMSRAQMERLCRFSLPTGVSEAVQTALATAQGTQGTQGTSAMTSTMTSAITQGEMAEEKPKTKEKEKRRPKESAMLPGEHNPDATAGANLCYDYMNKGICERQLHGGTCRFRHLDPDHPDAIADRFKNGLLSREDIERYKLRKCDPDEVNPFAPEGAKICFEFLNKRTCSRTNMMKICRYRHLLPNHPDAIADRARNAKKKS